jgi:hypothetical protein
MLQTVINLFLIVAAIAATLSLADSALRIWHVINRSN